MSLVRVTVASATRRVDLAVPGSLPVAELLPELARSVGVLDPVTAHTGYQLRTVDGRPLAGDVGLADQGVVDGGMLTLDALTVTGSTRLYDDVVEAMADAVDQVFVPVLPAVLRRISLGGAVLLLMLGALSLGLQDGTVAGVGATLLASVLVVGSVAVGSAGQGDAAPALAWAAMGFGAVAGAGLATEAGHGAQLAAAGGAVAVVGIGALVGPREHSPVVLPGVLVGCVCVAAGLIIAGTGLEARKILTASAVLALLGASFLPRLALALAEATAGGAHRRPAVHGFAAGVEQEPVHAVAVAGHRILLAMTAAVGIMVVAVAPVAVSLGVSGTLLAVAAASFLVLSARHSRSRAEVLVGVGFGGGALALTAVAVLWQHPQWMASTSVALIALGAAVLAFTLIPSASPRRPRLAEVAEAGFLIALLPLLSLATIAGTGGG